MTDFQYTTVPGKLAALFQKLRSVGVPPKATVQWLKSIGFTSSNDGSLLTIAKYIGFTDGSGVPTDTWRRYRGAEHKTIMASALRSAYRELFEVYEDAQDRPDRDLEHFFSTRSSAGKQAIGKTVSTFKNLAALADFAASPASTGPTVPTPKSPPVSGVSGAPTKPSDERVQPSLHIDIQIHIASDATSQQIDQIFASMAKHLYSSAKRDD